MEKICNRIELLLKFLSEFLESKLIVATKLIILFLDLIKNFAINRKRSKIDPKWLILIKNVEIYQLSKFILTFSIKIDHCLWNLNWTTIEVRIQMAWNLNLVRFDSEALIAWEKPRLSYFSRNFVTISSYEL